MQTSCKCTRSCNFKLLTRLKKNQQMPARQKTTRHRQSRSIRVRAVFETASASAESGKLCQCLKRPSRIRINYARLRDLLGNFERATSANHPFLSTVSRPWNLDLIRQGSLPVFPPSAISSARDSDGASRMPRLSVRRIFPSSRR